MPPTSLLKIPVPTGRNPFGGKGLAVTLGLLLEPRRGWTISDLARFAETSTALASRVVRQLLRSGLVVGDVRQGRPSALAPAPDLLREAASHWPLPVAMVAGGRVPVDLPLGGGPALAALGTQEARRPRIYVRSVEDVGSLLARQGGALVTEPVADWEISVVDFPLAAGVVPEVITALELGGAPRGREVLERSELLARWRDAART